jgi:hypothetical protein
MQHHFSLHNNPEERSSHIVDYIIVPILNLVWHAPKP